MSLIDRIKEIKDLTPQQVFDRALLKAKNLHLKCTKFSEDGLYDDERIGVDMATKLKLAKMRNKANAALSELYDLQRVLVMDLTLLKLIREMDIKIDETILEFGDG